MTPSTVSMVIPLKTTLVLGSCPLSFGGSPNLIMIASARSKRACFEGRCSVFCRAVEEEDVVDKDDDDGDAFFVQDARQLR